jgi:hypothetical protein
MLNANSINMTAATIFFMMWFLNKVYFLLQCCKYSYSFKSKQLFERKIEITRWGDNKANGGIYFCLEK